MAHAADEQIGEVTRSTAVARRTGGGAFFAFYAAVVVVQGGHVVEHIIQLVQVFVLGIPDDEALGLLGYVFAFQGTEEWLHIVFNVTYLVCLVAITPGVWRAPEVPLLAKVAFVFFGVWLEGWHVIEHLVIISNVVSNNGCPCPGILDARLGISDTLLHFGYNTIAYTATVIPFVYLLRQRRRAKRSTGGVPPANR
jgi:hypothetical protein